MGADKLLGNGDMLFLSPGTSQLLRGQGTYLSDDEITRVVDSIGVESPQFAGELMQLKTKDELEAAASGGFKNRDELYETAVDIVVRERRGSCSLLQRALGIGYGRAARLIDFMAEDGIVGQYNGSQAREVQISIEDWEAMSRTANESSAPVNVAAAATAAGTTAATPRLAAKPAIALATDHAASRPARRNKITPAVDEPSDLEDESLETEESEEEWDDSDAEDELLDDEEGDNSVDAESDEGESEEDALEDEEDELEDAEEDSEAELDEQDSDEEWGEDEDEEPDEDADNSAEASDDQDEDEWEEEPEPPKKSYHRAKR
jgi:S-DNA-T family DNA segregation ATPase FtsK/SpoIIIE